MEEIYGGQIPYQLHYSHLRNNLNLPCCLKVQFPKAIDDKILALNYLKNLLIVIAQFEPIYI